MSRNLRTALASLAVAALVGLAGCSGQGTTTSPSTTTVPQSASAAPSSTTSQDSPSMPAEASESSTPEPTAASSESSAPSSESSAAGHGKQTDQSLEQALQGVSLGKPLTPIPVSALRGQDKSTLPTVLPAECAFVGTGVAEPVIDGKPAAMATTTDQAGGISLIEMGTEDAAKALLAERDKALDNPRCKAVKLKSNDVEMPAVILAQKTDGHGLEDARIMKSIATSPLTGEKQERLSLLGRKGTVIVQVFVPVGREADQQAAVEKILANLG